MPLTRAVTAFAGRVASAITARVWDTRLPGDIAARAGVLADGTIISGEAPLAISGVAGTSTVTITTSASHGYGAGDVVTISGVTGISGVNGVRTIAAITSNTAFTLSAATGSGTYVSGGTVQRVLGGTGSSNEGVWNLLLPDGSRDGVVIRGREGSTKQLLLLRDFRGAAIFGVGQFGGAGLYSADANDLLFTAVGVFDRRFAANPYGGVRMAQGDPGGGIDVLALGDADTPPGSNPDGSHTAENAFATRAGVVLWSRAGRLMLRTSSGHQEELGAPSRRITWGIHASGSASTFQTIGCPAPALTAATAGGADTIESNFAMFTTAATANSVGGVTSPNYTHLRTSSLPYFYAKIQTDNTSVASTRYVVGLVAADRSGGAGPAASGASTATGIYFRYDAGIDSGAFWRTVTCDGTNATVTATTAAIAAVTTYELRAEVNWAASVVRFWVGDTLVATHSATIPSAFTQLGYQASVTTLAATARQIRVSRILVNQR
ncbi:hypothetical protein CcI49_03300 [Frankia sp. CcI49]|uniref:ubiquitin-activating E1 FCCH domain-containing protein n=1 Tax=Frankia sp. CcI49 TaxID=1745382 RepID=UPI00097559D7|nr:ubiquitin-activating E1 FCCH domain-containing protein [Frankia sp. CcI49]ONH62420.1 hypothetical protein CcI49_03300 [Frankia sp. CcI49]